MVNVALTSGALTALLLFTIPHLSMAGDLKSSLNAFIERDDNAVLPPDQAFQLDVKALDSKNLKASFSITPGHYLYRDRIKFEWRGVNENATANRMANADLPHGDIKQDPNFGKTEVFHNSFDTNITLENLAGETITLLANYQGCSEKGLCYAPIHKTYTIAIPATKTGVDSINNSAGNSHDDTITSTLKSGKLWLIVSFFFVAGILVSFTPCMLPMIPVLSGIIVGARPKTKAGDAPAPLNRMHSFNLSLAYTLGMALCYTLAGIAAGLSGHLLSTSLQSPWILAASAFIFVLLALAMFGWYELRLPSALQDRLVNASNRIKGGRFFGVFAMGAFSALILSPCVAPALLGALVYISQTHDVVLGGTALFALSMGMGVPLLLIGASAGAVLPKTGPWMNAVRNFFGVVMLAVALWLISPIIPPAAQLGLWAALMIVPAIYMHALDNLPTHANSAMKFAKGIAVIMLVTGIAMLAGALSGAKSPLQPLSALTASRTGTHSANASTSSLQFNTIPSLEALDNQLKSAQGKIVMLDFYADWCVACKELEHFTFSDPRVQQALANVVLLQADVTRDNAEDRALLKHFNLFGPPAILFFDAAGKPVDGLRVIGYQNAEQFLNTLSRLPAKS